MNPFKKFTILAALALTTSSGLAAITGQWDFNADLSSTIGQPITVLDFETETGSAFGTTTSFGIPNINGAEARVMRFPKTAAEIGGYSVPTGAAGNGGGFAVNQYTLIMDVLFPADSSDKRRALVNTDLFGDTEFAVQANNGIGSGAASDGEIQPNTWHRIVFAVDLSANPPVLDKFIDGVKVGTERPGGVDSVLSLLDAFYLFFDDTGESELGYINSLQIRDEKLTDGLIAALGGASATGILSGPPPNPYIASISPSADSFRVPSRSTVPPNPQIEVVIENGVSSVATNTIALKFDDATVTPTITSAGGTTTVTFTPPGLLEPLSIHSVAISFSDDAANNLGTQWRFAVGPFSPISAAAALPLGSAMNPGFKARTVQGPEYIQEVNNPTNFAATVQRGIQQLNGTLRDIEGNLVADESFPGGNPDGSENIDGPINFSTELEVGNFTGDSPFPGIPGENGHSTQFTTELLGFLELPAGVHKFGVTVNASRVDVNDDDNFALFVGQNPRDAFSQVLGSYVRTTAPAFDENSQNHNEFTFFVPEAGLYPVRLVYVQSGRQGSLELYSIDPDTGEKTLVNEPGNPAAIKAFRDSTSPKSGAPYVAELSPRPGTSGNDPTRPVQVLISDDRTTLDPNSLQLTFNGAVVAPTVTKSGRLTTVSFQPNPNRTQTTNEFTLVFADSGAPQNRFTNSWSFTTTVNTTGSSSVVRGQWDFNNANLSATVGLPLEYFDGAGGQTETKTQFGTTTSFGIPDIAGQPAAVMRVPGDLNNRIGYTMRHGIAPNGGGTKVNQYTLIYDVLIAPEGPGAAAMIQIDDLNNTSDGDLFWQGNNFGQGQGGYVGTGIFTPGEWHRVAIAVDLAATPAVITKFVDGIKQHDWNTDGLDGRRALLEHAILFADGDQDERRVWYVNSVQVREGKLSDGELAYLGSPSANGIPQNLPAVNVKGQWDFDGNLNATVGRAMEFFDGAGGETETKTEFGTASSFGIPLIDGTDATVMRVPGDLNNKIGYIMHHGIEPNGGGSLVNQYTLTFDVLIAGTGPGAAAMIQIDDPNNTSDGDLFWQGNNFGQGQGGYVGTGIFTPDAWHRVSLAVDLSANPPVITKFVDGIKQHDWNTDGIDGRRALRDFAILFADGDQDERRVWYVNSIQVREGKLSDAQLALLGRPTGDGLPIALPQSSVQGQWDFEAGLEATVGKALEFFDGVGGDTETKTEFGVTTDIGIPDIAGQPARVMRVPGDLSNKIGYTMRHGIAPNGGGAKVNQYTLIYDVLIAAEGPGAAAMIQIDDLNNTSDGDLFWQGNNFGQGQGGYVGTGIFTPGEWHRVAMAVDLAATPAVITKFVDGVKQDDWRTDGLDGRRALLDYAVLFADGDQDERRVWYVNSIQIQNRKLSDAELEALGTPTAAGLPLTIAVQQEETPILTFNRAAGTLQISWPATLSGFTLESTPDLGAPNWQPVAGVTGNSITVQTQEQHRFYRLRK